MIMNSVSSQQASEQKVKSDSSSFRRFKRRFGDNLKEFCLNASFDGLHYLGETNRSFVERFCWLVVIIVSLVVCTLVTMKQYTKWQTFPVIVSFSETSTPVWSIPFPAVTICSEVKFKQSELNYTKLMTKYMTRKNLTAEEYHSLLHTSLLCNFPFLGSPPYIRNAQVDYLQEIAPKIKDLFRVCTWRAAKVDCEAIFTPIFNHHGNCFTFNSLAADELFTNETVQKKGRSGHPSHYWDPEGGYQVWEDRNDTYPWRTSAGSLAGLYVTLESKIELEGDPNCREPIEGFKVMLHNPAVFPQVRQPFFQIPSKRQIVVWVRPEIMTTDDQLKNYIPTDRQCYFQKERYLRFFSVYTQESCEMECISNYTMKKCGCVMFYMPRNSEMPVCGSSMVGCVVKGLIQHHSGQDSYCQCLPSCTEIKYGMQMSQAKYLWEQAKHMYKLPGSISIAFQDMQIISNKRSELYGAADFLANCGGILGLFLGFSIMSMVEIVYFLILRPCFYFKSNTNNDESLSKKSEGNIRY